MKTLKTITAALLMAISFSAFAVNEYGIRNDKLKLSYPAQAFIDAVAHGKVGALPEVLDKEVKYTTTQGTKVVSFNKGQMLKSFQSMSGVEQNCISEYTIVESTPTISLVKVTMKYENFSKITYLNMANSANGRKITSISSSIF